MPVAWRIVKKRHGRAAFDGEGARVHGGRWNSPGVPMVYLAENRSLALLEILVHVVDEQVLNRYVFFKVAYGERQCLMLDASELPRNWKSSPPPEKLRRIGDRWCASGRSLLLSVPSAIIPRERILLLNPQHAAVRHLRVTGPEPISIDPRLLRGR